MLRLVTIVIVEDHRMFREVLRKICVDELGFRVVGEAEDGDSALKVVRSTQPDLVLLDLHLPNRDGFEVIQAMRSMAARSRILILSSHCDDYTVYRAEQYGVEGFVDKNTNSVDTLKAAISAVAGGEGWFSDAFRRLKRGRQRSPDSFDKLLTKRERAILALVGMPMADAEIAQHLAIAVETVEKHRYNILRKLGIASTAELARYSREHGFTLAAPRNDPGGALLP